MFLINFIKSLILPSKMIKYRTMSVIISIAIFLLASYVLAFPQSHMISKERYNLVDNQNAYGLQVFQALSNSDLAIIRNTGCRVERGAMTCDASVIEGEPYIFNVSVNDQDIHLYIVFDLFDVLDPEAQPTYHINDRFVSLDPIAGVDRYLVVFYQNQVLYKTPQLTQSLLYTNTVDFDLSQMDDGSLLSYRMIDMFVPLIRTENTFYTFISCVIYPFIIILVVWLLFRSAAPTMTFKDYYNTGAIASIVPLIVIFSLSWVFPRLTLMQYYSVAFGVFYLFIIFKTTSRTKIT